MRVRRCGLGDDGTSRLPAVVAFVTLDVVLLIHSRDIATYWWAGPSEAVAVHTRTLWLLAGVVLAYCVWLALLARRWVSAAGSPGFAIAALGVELRHWGDFLWSLPDSFADESVCFTFVSVRDGFDPSRLSSIVATARTGGLVACALGLLIALAFGVQDFRRRYSRLKRLRGRVFRMPRWF